MKIFRINSLLRQETRDRALRNKMHGHSEEPPAFLWEKVEAQLPQQRRGGYGMLFFLLPLAALFAGFIVYLAPALRTAQSVPQTGAEMMEMGTGRDYDLNGVSASTQVNPEYGHPQNLITSEPDHIYNETAGASAHTSANTFSGRGASVSGNKPGALANSQRNTSHGSRHGQQHTYNSIGAGAPAHLPAVQQNTLLSGALEDIEEAHTRRTNSLLGLIDIRQNYARRHTMELQAGRLDGYRDPLQEKKNTAARYGLSLGVEYGMGTVLSPSMQEMPSADNSDANTNNIVTSSKEDVGKAQSLQFAGLSVKVPLSRSFSISGGLHYSTLRLGRVHTDASLEYEDNPLVDSATIQRIQQEAKAGNSDASSFLQQMQNGSGRYLTVHVHNSRAWSTYQFLDVPLRARYDLPLGRFSLFAETGVSARFMLSNTLSYTNSEGEAVTENIMHSSGNRLVQLSATANAGAAWHISPRLQLELMPGVSHALTRLNDNGLKPSGFYMASRLYYNF